MTITARPYTDDDLPYLQTALAGWIQQAGDCGYCHTGDVPHRIYNGNRGRLPLPDLVRLWEENGTIIGFVIAQPYHDGFDVFLSPAYRGGDCERELLQWAYDTTRRFMNQIERGEKAVMSDVDGGDTSRAPLLLELGFTQGEHWLNFTERSLSEPIPDNPPPEGFIIRPSTMADYGQLAAVHNGAFGSTWSPELYRDEVMNKPGYSPEREIVVVAPDGRFAAFTVTWLDTVNRVGLFEPVGVHSEFQRRGLGRALMSYAMLAMCEQGIERTQVSHAVDNRASTGLYTSLGFRTKQEVTGYTRP